MAVHRPDNDAPAKVLVLDVLRQLGRARRGLSLASLNRNGPLFVL